MSARSRAALVQAVDPNRLSELFPTDEFVRWQLGTAAMDEVGEHRRSSAAWRLGAAWAQLDDFGGRSRLVLGGRPADAAALLRDLVPGTIRPDRMSVVRAAVALLPESLRPVGGDDWDWFTTTAAPLMPLPGEDLVTRINLRQFGELSSVVDLLHQHSPRYSRDPRDATAAWWAIPDATAELAAARPAGAALAAVVAVEPLPRAVHLASLATRTEARGRGLASALVAAVTRASLAAGRQAVVLGMYADNDAARRMYRRLGFAETHHWRSGHLPC